MAIFSFEFLDDFWSREMIELHFLSRNKGNANLTLFARNT